MFVLRRRSERTAGGNKQESCYIDKEKTLEDLGLVFCESTGCLLERGSGTRHELKGPFKTKKALEEKRCLHEAIGMEICNMIEQRGFKKERCVLNAQIMAKEGFVQIPNVFSYFYHNLTGSENRILVLVSGFSRARVGQWSGDILSRQGLKSGSMLPYLDRCKERNMGVVLCNPYEQFYWRGRTWTHLPLEADEDVVNPPEMIIGILSIGGWK